jgi:CubicO group peptidase (beta-lactamase class C family)
MIVLVVCLSVVGQVPTLPAPAKTETTFEQPAPQVPPGVHEMTATDVEAFLDGLVPLQLKQDDVAGATVAVVKDGKLLFAKGYGYAYVEKKKPVTPETLFRPGINFEVVYLDLDHAAVRAGKT